MKNRPFYFEIKNLITQFIGAFNDVAIKRFDRDRNETGESVGVGFMYAPKQRVIEDILNPSKNITLPAISVSVSRIARDSERVFNKIDGHYIAVEADAGKVRKVPQPVPINLTVNMSIIARYQADIEQIISNFIPNCDPYIVVSWKLPTTENTTYEREIRTIIEWSGDLNIQYPVEMTNSQLARVTCDTTFIIKGWLFKEIDTTVGIINTIHANFIQSNLGDECFIFNNLQDYNTTFDNTSDIESLTIV